jgi:hypothetical protein
MQFQAIRLEQGAEESMRWQTKSPLKEGCTYHDEPLHRSRRYRPHGQKRGSKLRCRHVPLTHEILQALLGDLRCGPTRRCHETQKERRLTPL